MSRTFLDTNVFLYAFLNQDVGKKSVAAKIISDAVRHGCGFVSLQVVNEFCNVMVTAPFGWRNAHLKSRVFTESSSMTPSCFRRRNRPAAMRFSPKT